MSTIPFPGGAGDQEEWSPTGLDVGQNVRVSAVNRRGRPAHGACECRLIRIAPLFLLLPWMGCKTFSYTPWDVEKERRLLLESRDTPFGVMGSGEKAR